ncbi:hypothetical protein [Salinibacterium sp. PAMC 21357]|uniref:hypothetical protein n=1 Tax=Salinibacterium sp. PAMC 21357 TaxID=1112215 RepID=UPI000289D18E|nr:hypothetical protein [Salinibacterium sp. PAMC 21357]
MRFHTRGSSQLQFALLGIEAIVFAAALIASHIGSYAMFALFALLCLIAVVALIAGVSDEGARTARTTGAGILGVGAALGLPLWVFGVTLMVYPDDVERACAESFGRAGLSQSAEIVRSLVPPGLFCVPEGGGSAPILASSASDLLVSLGILFLIIAALACAVCLSARDLEGSMASAKQTLKNYLSPWWVGVWFFGSIVVLVAYSVIHIAGGATGDWWGLLSVIPVWSFVFYDNARRSRRRKQQSLRSRE